MSRYLVVKVETDEAFVAIRRALHDFSKDTGEKLSDMGVDAMTASDRFAVIQAFSDTAERAKRFHQ